MAERGSLRLFGGKEGALRLYPRLAGDVALLVRQAVPSVPLWWHNGALDLPLARNGKQGEGCDPVGTIRVTL